MSETKSSGAIEKGAKWYRNFNILGAAVLTGAGVYLAPISPELATASFVLASIDIAQAGVAEIVRQWRDNKSKSPASSKVLSFKPRTALPQAA